MRKTIIPFLIIHEIMYDTIYYNSIDCHMVFGVKMVFMRKSRQVSVVRRIYLPSSMNCIYIVYIECVRILILEVALNDLDVLSSSIGNSYLNYQFGQKVWFVAVDGFVKYKGWKLIILRTMYGLNSCGASWRDQLAQTMACMGLVPCRDEFNVWMRANKKAYGFEYQGCILLYMDDALEVSHHQYVIMNVLDKTYRLKYNPVTNKSFCNTTWYLGAYILEYQLPGGLLSLFSYAYSYVNQAVYILDTQLMKTGGKFCKKVIFPLTIDILCKLI